MVFTASIGIMVLELTAGRLISRYLGSSLYTWTAVIGVVLAGISVGNYAGGHIADRLNPRLALSLLFALAAAGCLTVLPVNAWTGNGSLLLSLSWPMRIFLHVAVTFTLPALILGATSPIVARVALKQGMATGRTVGIIYACGTAGTIGGTFLTGFYLIPMMDVTHITFATAAVFAMLAAAATVLPQAPITTTEDTLTTPKDNTPTGTAWSRLAPIVSMAMIGACVMMLELSGARIVSKLIGQSLYTWTTVIGMVLGGIAAGNFFGGRVADRFAPEKTLPILYGLCSSSCVLVVAVEGWFAESEYWAFVPRSRAALIYGACILLTPSFILGMTMPVIAKWALDRAQATGRTLGNLYAWNAAGSVTGTFIAGFYLIDFIGTRGVVLLLVVMLGAMAFLASRRTRIAYGWSVACVSVLGLSFAPWSTAERAGVALGLRPPHDSLRVYEEESQYSRIYVRADQNNPTRRTLILDTLQHGITDLADPLTLLYEYGRSYSSVVNTRYGTGEPLSVFVVGGGGYVFPHYLELTRPGSRIEVAEIDPAVTRVAHESMGLPPDTSIITANMDARNRITDLIRMKRDGGNVPEFDCVFGDSFSGFAVPYHLTTAEFTADIRELLKDDGIYLFNLIDNFATGEFLGAAINTCLDVFPNVHVLNSGDSLYRRSTFTVICSNQPLDTDAIVSDLISRQSGPVRFLTTEERSDLERRSRGLVLTDNFAPVENLLAGLWNELSDSASKILSAKVTKLQDAGRVDEAESLLQDTLIDHPDLTEAHLMLGNILHRQRRLDEAALHYQTALDLEPDNAINQFSLGNVLVKLGRLPEAIALLEDSTRRMPDHSASYIVLGNVFYVSGVRELSASNQVEATRLLNQACLAYAEAIRLNPNNHRTQHDFGRALMAMGQFDEALVRVNTALRLQPDFPEAEKTRNQIQAEFNTSEPVANESNNLE
jgi:tetratricopeptide (TPR) repeat protein